ncbi:hypothetical protein U1Q18_047855 [Sarracenia purpurea var. burkii]
MPQTDPVSSVVASNHNFVNSGDFLNPKCLDGFGENQVGENGSPTAHACKVFDGRSRSSQYVDVKYYRRIGWWESHIWCVLHTSVYRAPQRRLPMPPAFALNNVADTNFYTHRKHQMLVNEFPEQLGQPECSYFLKTGDCKYRFGCKFHHPKNRFSMSASFALSDKGLPLRPVNWFFGIWWQ